MSVVFGSLAVDQMLFLPRLPEPNQTTLIDRMDPVPGGKGANQAVAATRAGGRVMLAGAVGRDDAARIARSGPEASGVDTSLVVEAAGHTGCVSFLRDPKGQVQIVHALGANLMARADQIPDALLGPDTTLLVQLELPVTETAALMLRARRLGARVVLNFAPARIIATEALRAADVLVIGEGVSGWLAEHLGASVSAPSLRAALGCAVVRALGVSGLEYARDGAIGRIDARKAREVADETGAQDCLSGVLAAGLDAGLSLEDAAARANAAASLCCERIGSQAAMPLGTEIDVAMTEPPRR